MLYAIKNCGLAFKDVDTERGTVSGYFAAFDSQDSDEDIIKAGAFKKSISESGPSSNHPRIKHLLDHDTTKVPAVLTALEEDAHGLRYTSKAGRHTLGRDFVLMCQDGIITEHSHGFNVVKSGSNPESTSGRGRVITESRLWEGSSLQAWGANHRTPLLGAKSLTATEQATLLAEATGRLSTLTRALKGAYSDDLCERLEIQAAQLEALCKSLTPTEPAPATLEQVEPSSLIGAFQSSFSFLA